MTILYYLIYLFRIQQKRTIALNCAVVVLFEYTPKTMTLSHGFLFVRAGVENITK